MSKIRVIAAVLTEKELTLYSPDGEPTVILQGDERMASAVEQAMLLERGHKEVLITLKGPEDHSFKSFEKKTNGLIKFFRVAKEKVAHLFSSEEEREAAAELLKPRTLGVVPQPTAPTATPALAPEPVFAQRDRVLNKPAPLPVMGAGLLTPETSVNHEKFAGVPLGENETIVASVDGKVVPGMEKLANHFKHVEKGNNPEGLKNLIQRLSVMIEQRGHSVEDVLKFLERADLEAALDGDIIAYKRLTSHSRHRGSNLREGEGIFYDCHSQRVSQRVGSLVRVDESLVDKNRRNECSNGLHIARRAYLGSFSGNVIVMCRIRPEDIITVPHGDANKVRVCAYHIIGQVDQNSFAALCGNKPMTSASPEAQRMLADALAGRHVGILEEVRITGQVGQGVIITPMGEGASAVVAQETAPKRAQAIADPVKPQSAPQIDPRKVNEEKAPVAPDPKPEPAAKTQTLETVKAASPRILEANKLLTLVNNSHLTNAQRMVAAGLLMALKKKSKVSWEKLGVPDSTGTKLDAILKPQPLAEPEVEDEAKETLPTAKSTKPVEKTTKSKLPAGTKEVVDANDKPVKMETPTGSRAQLAMNLFKEAIGEGGSIDTNRKAALELVALKKRTKVSWTALGITSPELLDPILNAVQAPKEEPVKASSATKKVSETIKEAAAEPKPAPKPAKEKVAKPSIQTQAVQASMKAGTLKGEEREKAAVTELLAGVKSKATIALEYSTDPRTLGRWAQKHRASLTKK